MQKRVMQGWPFTPEEREQILHYCDERRRRAACACCRTCCRTSIWTSRCITANSPPRPRSWSTAACRSTWRCSRSSPTRTTWRTVRDAMVPAIDAQYGVYVRNAAGDWSFNMELFAAYLEREGIALAAARDRQAQHAAQDLRGHEQGLAAARRAAAAALRARQDAQDQAGGRRTTAAIARCCGRSRPRPRARSRRPRSGFSRRRCGCGR